MSQDTTTTITGVDGTVIDTTLKGRQEQIVRRIVATCRRNEENATGQYIALGQLCDQFATLYVQDGGKKADATGILKGRLASDGLRNLDVSTYRKSAALALVLPLTAKLAVSVVKCLLPLITVKGDTPALVEGLSRDVVIAFVEKVFNSKLKSEQVGAAVADLLGKKKSMAKQWEKCAKYLTSIDDKAIRTALYKNETLRNRLMAIVAGLTVAVPVADAA